MDDFEFGSINTSVKMKEQDLIVENILITSYKSPKDDKHLLILLDTRNRNPLVGAISTWIRKQFPGFSYDIVTSSLLDVNEEAIKKEGIFRFYKRAQSDFKKYIITDKTIVISLGSALSAITLSSDLTVECFYDFVFNKTYFYSPETDTYVYPIDAPRELFTNEAGYWAPKDCSRVQFALYQFQQIKTFYEQRRIPPAYTKPTIVELKTKEDWKRFYNKFKDYTGICYSDTETSGFHPLRNRIGCFTCTFDGKTGYFIPWESLDPKELGVFLSNKLCIGHNFKFDKRMLRSHGTEVRIHRDTLTLAHNLNEMRKNSLKSVAYYYTPFGGYDMALEDYKDRYSPETYLDIPVPILKEYATMDVIVGYIANEAMEAQLTELDQKFPPIHENGWAMRKLYEEVCIPALNAFSDIEDVGVCVDVEVWERNARILQTNILEIMAVLNTYFGINDDSILQDMMEDDDGEESSRKATLQSTMKLGKILEAKGWEDLGRNKRGVFLTGDAQLIRWANLGHKEALDIQKLRSYLTMQKTFMGKPNNNAVGWRRHVIHHPDGTYRIHPSYMVMMMDTFRSGCGDPNFQQIPSQAIDAHLFKQIFTTPDPQKYLQVTLDKSAFQIRLSTHDQGDVNDPLHRRFIENVDLDLHSITGYSTFAHGQEYVFIGYKGKEYIYSVAERVKAIRNGQEIFIPAGEIRESDELLT